ncbi:MAG: polyprenyl diphosphate synthase [Candidatus Parvarchaeota archaeon]|nr:polyprenyl diphosphate synthase [Candidatus Jingweiarchaeum tengchongense]MCW1310601.1 polyprenyl diphosphate synthase [Candidatus Jingweiarchaeum tengchongense]
MDQYQRLLKKIKNGKIPEHVAIIMDGNRRWAKEHNLPQEIGHRKGKDNLENILQAAFDIGIRILTLYSLSLYNLYRRPKEEFNYLMKLFKEGFEQIVNDKRIKENKVRINVFGKIELLPANVRKVIKKAVSRTKNYTNYFLNFCIAYDGREEIVNAVEKICKLYKEGKIKYIDEDLIKSAIYTCDFPAPDLIIRTGKEKRLSGFLLWDSSYSEIFFSNKYWPDFKKEDFARAILDFQKRERRFGK